MSDWEESALCASIGGDFWFPEKEGIGAGSMIAAKRICHRCPVRAECLEYALACEGGLERGNRHGIFGGLGPGERARLAQQRATGLTAA